MSFMLCFMNTIGPVLIFGRMDTKHCNLHKTFQEKKWYGGLILSYSHALQHVLRHISGKWQAFKVHLQFLLWRHRSGHQHSTLPGVIQGRR